MIGSRTKLCERPKATIPTNDLKKMLKTKPVENARTDMAMKVENAPWNTELPSQSRAFITRSFLVPVACLKAWAI
jgi:hypothetical protein